MEAKCKWTNCVSAISRAWACARPGACTPSRSRPVQERSRVFLITYHLLFNTSMIFSCASSVWSCGSGNDSSNSFKFSSSSMQQLISIRVRSLELYPQPCESAPAKGFWTFSCQQGVLVVFVLTVGGHVWVRVWHAPRVLFQLDGKDRRQLLLLYPTLAEVRAPSKKRLVSRFLRSVVSTR